MVNPKRKGTQKRKRRSLLPSLRLVAATVAVYCVSGFIVSVVYENYNPLASQLEVARSLLLKTRNQSTNERFGIFYAIYTNRFQGGSEKDVVDRQLDVVRRSHLSQYPGAINVFYQTFGDTTISPDHMDELCAPKGISKAEINCIDEGHRKKEAERPILQKIYDYCTEKPKNTVTFIRTTPSDSNRVNRTDHEEFWWREHLTTAAMSEECLFPPDDACNVCGLQFSPLPMAEFSGGIWTAKCSYIADLLNPKIFEDEVNATIIAESRLMKLKILNFTLFDKTHSWPHGDNRDLSVWDQWITGHPSFTPCDLSGSMDPRFWQIGRERYSMSWSLAPRQALTATQLSHLSKTKVLAVLGDENVRKREYSFLPGNLVKSFQLYGGPPEESSWVWRFFPDASFFLEATKKFGREAIERVIPRAPSYPQDESQHVAVFYHIYVSYEPKKAELALSIIEEQMVQVSNSYIAIQGNQTVTVFYSTVGGRIHHSWMQTLCRPLGLDCRLLQHHIKGHEDETLQHVHEFCNEHNWTKSVVYIHSKGSFHPDGFKIGYEGQDNWRRHMTDAATSQACAIDNKSTCDVCGLMFQPIPQEHFPGNMWRASCGYIQKLSPPKTLLNRRSSAIPALENLLKTDFPLEAKFCPFIPMTYGLERYFSEQWIASHPSVRPCDLSSTPTLKYWKEGSRNSEFVWGMAPRHGMNASWDFYNYCPDSDEYDVLNNKAERLREYFFLAGHLYRWIVEYNTVPSDDSWVYKFFPDGEEWKTMVAKHKVNALIEMDRLWHSSDTINFTVL